MELILGASSARAGRDAHFGAGLSCTSWFLIRPARHADAPHRRRAVLVFEERFWSGIDLAQLYRERAIRRLPTANCPPAWRVLFRAGFKEFSRLVSAGADMDADAILEGSRRAMRVALMRETDRIEQHLPFLASVGSTSPYIGLLLGTVWGIMHSFQGAGQRDASHFGDRRARDL